MKNTIDFIFDVGDKAVDTLNEANNTNLLGLGLIAGFCGIFYTKYLANRFRKFVDDAEVDYELIQKINKSESYSNCFYAILETVRQTNSKIGLTALALIYKDHNEDQSYIMSAAQAFSQISDDTLRAFVTLYECIPPERNHLILKTMKDGEAVFDPHYNEAVELIRRNFFVSSEGPSSYANGPIQGMKWLHTESYYRYCKEAIRLRANNSF